MTEDEKIYEPLWDVEKVVSILNRITIFGGLSDKQLRFLFKHLQKVCYKADEYVFKEGDEPGYIYIVESGKIKIVMDSDKGPLELYAFGVGQCFGETAVIGIQRHPAGAVATEDSELIVLSREVLLSIFDTDKESFGILILNIAREACRRLQKTDEILLQYVNRK
jgi:CRP-like cAMP-binding protein